MPKDTAAIHSAPTRLDETTTTLLRMFYVSEVYGVETFACMLRSYQGLTPDQRRKLEACRQLEIAAVRLLLDHIVRTLRMEVRPPRRARQAAETLAPLKYASWDDRMAELEALAIRGVTSYRSFKNLYGHHAPTLCAWLLAKEMALRDFARDELDGETEGSIARITALLAADPGRRAAA